MREARSRLKPVSNGIFTDKLRVTTVNGSTLGVGANVKDYGVPVAPRCYEDF